MKRILITGSAGFIFSSFMRKAITEKWNYEFVSIDQVLEPHCIPNAKWNRKTHPFYVGDVADPVFVNNVFKLEDKIDYVIHGAAESFVDSSLESPFKFVHSNVLGTQNMLDFSYKYNVKKFLYISTDECGGQLKPGEKPWKEDIKLNPRNSYSASKAAGELITAAFKATHDDFNYVITRCCNNYGPSQAERNLIPKIITSVLNNKKIPIHDKGIPIREWIYVEDHNTAVMTALENGNNEIFNIGSGFELSLLDTVNTICDIMGKGHDLVEFVGNRPGQDFRYSVDSSKIRALGWEPKHSFDQGIKKTIEWYKENKGIYI